MGQNERCGLSLPHSVGRVSSGIHSRELFLYLTEKSIFVRPRTIRIAIKRFASEAHLVLDHYFSFVCILPSSIVLQKNTITIQKIIEYEAN